MIDETKMFKGFLQVHQITGNVYNLSEYWESKPITIIMEIVRYFYGDINCQGFKIGVRNYEHKS